MYLSLSPTVDMVVYGEACRYPLYINTYRKLLLYVLNPLMTRLSRKADELLHQKHESGKLNLKSINKVVSENGSGRVWVNQGFTSFAS